MAMQVTIGGAVLGSGVGATVGSQVASAPGGAESGPAGVATRAATELAYTGVGGTTLMLVVGLILVLMGLMILGVARRHGRLDGSPSAA